MRKLLRKGGKAEHTFLIDIEEDLKKKNAAYLE